MTILVEIQYDRSDVDFHRGTFRVRGDVIDVFPAYEDDTAIRIEMFGDEVEAISHFDPLRGTRGRPLDKVALYPASHYVTPKEKMEKATEGKLIDGYGLAGNRHRDPRPDCGVRHPARYASDTFEKLIVSEPGRACGLLASSLA